MQQNAHWAAWLRDKRKAKRLTRKALAEAVSIDPSYVTLIERDGLIPKRGIVERIGAQLDRPESALIVAGYVPSQWIHRFLEWTKCPPDGSLPNIGLPALTVTDPKKARKRADRIIHSIK